MQTADRRDDISKLTDAHRLDRPFSNLRQAWVWHASGILLVIVLTPVCVDSDALPSAAAPTSSALSNLAGGGGSHLFNWADKTFGQGLTSLTKGSTQSLLIQCASGSGPAGMHLEQAASFPQI